MFPHPQSAVKRYTGVQTPMNRPHGIVAPTKSRGPIRPQCDGIGHACRGAGEMARLYRLALNGRIPSDEMTRFIYALKEIRAFLEAEIRDSTATGLAVARYGQPQWSRRRSSADFPARLT
jgi:hypothetical protein